MFYCADGGKWHNISSCVHLSVKIANAVWTSILQQTHTDTVDVIENISTISYDKELLFFFNLGLLNILQYNNNKYPIYNPEKIWWKSE